MTRKAAVCVAAVLGFLFAAIPGARAAVSVREAVWSAESRTLTVEARERRSREQLSVTYAGEEYPMAGARGGYSLDLGPVCYSDTVTVTSPTGASTTADVSVTNGSASGYECGAVSCPDGDGDGFADASCGGTDCADWDPFIFPGAVDTCGDGVDQDCSGADLPCGTGPHGALLYRDYPSNCLECHEAEARDVHGSTHYQWTGSAPDMSNQPGILQGKLTNAVNSYCINILGDWPVCGSCHAGRGKRPDDPTAGLENIDCLVCHSETYAAARTRLPDGSMGVAAPDDGMVRNVGLPTRIACLNCHAKAGGGDGVKRGDLSLATASNADPMFDVHMNSSGSDLACQECHVFRNHLVIGKGSDLRPTDDVSRGSEVSCPTCHAGKDSRGGHDSSTIGDHVARVACQTCHIPTYAKVPTETHRDWRLHHDGSPADGTGGAGHPYTEKASTLVPSYRFWNRTSDNYLLGDDALVTYDPVAGTYPTSRPLGSVGDPGSRLYPFKYKTAVQPKTVADDRLVALDTFEYLKASGDVLAAVGNGLANMGYSPFEPFEWVLTDTFQLLNHGVSPSSDALRCSECHGSAARMDLQGELGYSLKGPRSVVCTQCHGREDDKPFEELHHKHVTDKGYDCSWCHVFSRPERGLRLR